MPNIAKWKLIPAEQFKQIVAESQSFAEIAKKIGYATGSSGGVNASIKAGILFYNLDISHLKGQYWNKGNYHFDWMTIGTKYRSNYTSALIKLRGHKCQNCGLEKWLGIPIALEGHHINGDNTDNRSENLLLLCPNCHAQTPTYRNRKIVED